MKRLDLFFWLLFAIFLGSFFVPAYMLPDGPIIGYRCSWVPLTGVKEGSFGAALGTLANFIVWGTMLYRRAVRSKSMAFLLTVLTFLSTFSWLVIMEGFTTERLLVGYWMWAISSPLLIYIGHLRTKQPLVS